MPAAWGRAAVMLVGTLIAIYLASQFLRNSVGVIAPDLAREMGLTAADLGLLSSAFFFAFAAAQLPLGVALDRFGPRACLLVCAAVTVAGAAWFATATSAAGLTLARALLGIGCSASFMAPLTIYARTFPPDRFATLTGLQMGIGTLGTLLATAPLAFAAHAIGWRASFLVVAALTLALGFLVALVLGKDGASPAKHETLRENLAGIVAAIRTPWCGTLFLMHLAGYSSFTLIVGLWGGPYLSHIYGYGLEARGEILLIPALTQIVGALAWGPMDRLMRSYKRPVMLGTALTALAYAFLAATGKPAPWVLLVWLAAIGFLTGYVAVMIAHGRALFPPHLVGRGITLLNMGSMGGVFVTQAVSGAVISLFPAEGGAYPLDAYRLVFALQSLFILVALAAYWRVRERQLIENSQEIPGR